MKQRPNIFPVFFLILFMLVFAHALKAQEKGKEASIKSLLNSKNFVFKAQSVSPTGGTLRQLTADYDLIVSPDTIRTFLPYFGRAYSAPINPSDGGINFTSTKFDYRYTERKKGRLEIAILPKDAQDVRQMLLNVSRNGSASLLVLSNNRQPISFNGYITERKSNR